MSWVIRGLKNLLTERWAKRYTQIADLKDGMFNGMCQCTLSRSEHPVGFDTTARPTVRLRAPAQDRNPGRRSKR